MAARKKGRGRGGRAESKKALRGNTRAQTRAIRALSRASGGTGRGRGVRDSGGTKAAAVRTIRQTLGGTTAEARAMYATLYG
jgi:hypothetical protein